MTSIPVGCRLDQVTIQQFDQLASDRGISRADLFREAIAHELGNTPRASLETQVAALTHRIDRLENILLSFGGAITRL